MFLPQQWCILWTLDFSQDNSSIVWHYEIETFLKSANAKQWEVFDSEL